jgi:hypothetical protein
MKRFASLLVGAGLLSFTAVAQAGELVDAAAKAEELAKGGRYIEAMDQITEAMGSLWDASPMSFRKAFFVSSPPSGFGVYELRQTPSFKPGEKILIYVEPVGYGYKQDGNVFTVELVGDVEVKTSDGKVLGGQKAFTKFGLSSRVKNREFYAFITYDFSGLAAGNYVAGTTLTDSVTGKSGSFDLPFSIAP